MGRAVRVLGVVLGLLVAGTHSAFAQAVVTGTVKDITGAVLPGATVEVASPALIEKVRSAVSDSTGQYRIVDLRPGIYTVTCTLTGFNTSKREGIELAGTGTVSLNFELKVGAIEETVTVTGETPLVDLQSTSTERTVSRELLDAVPSGRTVHNMAALIPGITVTATGISAQDVGGSSVGGLQQAAIHGGSTGDQRVLMDGLPLNTAQGNLSGFISNMSTTQEFTIDTSGVSAEDNAGGVRMNIVPREGGNTYRSTIYADWSTPGLTASNFNDDLAARHMVAPNPLKNLKETYTFNPAGGGPIMKDKIWFYLGGNYTRLQQHVNIFPNLNANNPSSYLYVADTSKEQSVYDVKLWSLNGRLTTQVNPKNKFSFYIDHQYRCICAFANATTSPEAQAFSAYPAQHLISATWTSPVTSRLLLDAAYLNRLENWGMRLNPATSRDAIRVNDQVLNVTYRSFGEDTFNYNGNNNARASLSYVTGAHAFKGGFQAQWADHKDQAYSNPQNIDYTFSNQLPTQITMYADPRFTETQSLDFGLYVQDRYTVGRFTLNGGLRYDRFHSYYPAATVGPVALAPNRNLSFPAGDGVDWKDITYRLGSAWDVFGNGKTALKITLSKYLGAQATTGTFASSLNPANRITNSTTRPWDDLTFQVGDPRRGNFVVDCDLLNAAKNNECGPLNSNTFGQSVIATNYDPAILNGWGIRNYNWEFGASVQHEIASRVSVDVGYFRRWYGNLTTTFNRAVAASDFGQFNYVAPVDPALPGGGGQTIGPLYNLNQNKVGQTDNFLTLSDNVGGQTQRWHGVDANVRVRARNGLSLQGGFSTGTTLTESCGIRAAHPDTATLNPYCLQNTIWLTQAKGLVTYAVPRVDMQVSAGLQSLPGPAVAANQTVPGSIFVPQLQRPYTGSSTATINLAQPGTVYGDRAYQLDLRVGKVLKYGRLRTSINADLFNMLNASAVVSENTTYSTADATLWRRPLAIMPGRLVKLSAQVDF